MMIHLTFPPVYSPAPSSKRGPERRHVVMNELQAEQTPPGLAIALDVPVVISIYQTLNVNI